MVQVYILVASACLLPVIFGPGLQASSPGGICRHPLHNTTGQEINCASEACPHNYLCKQDGGQRSVCCPDATICPSGRHPIVNEEGKYIKCDPEENTGCPPNFQCIEGENGNNVCCLQDGSANDPCKDVKCFILTKVCAPKMPACSSPPCKVEATCTKAPDPCSNDPCLGDQKCVVKAKTCVHEPCQPEAECLFRFPSFWENTSGTEACLASFSVILLCIVVTKLMHARELCL